MEGGPAGAAVMMSHPNKPPAAPSVAPSFRDDTESGQKRNTSTSTSTTAAPPSRVLSQSIARVSWR